MFNLNCQEEETGEGDGEPGHGDQLPVHLALHEWGPVPGQGEREHGQYVDVDCMYSELRIN